MCYPHPIQFIGPVIEMRWKRSRFPVYMKAKFPTPIYTIRVPGKRFYFVNSIPLITTVQRHSRILSFDPPIVQGVRSILGVSQTTVDIMNRDVAAGGEDSFLFRLNKAVHSSLSAGRALGVLSENAVRLLEYSLSELAAKGPTVVKMYDWVRRTVMVATTDSVFGPRNPFHDEKKHRGLDPIRDERYAVVGTRCAPRVGYQTDASEFVRRRISFYLQEGVPIKDISRLAVADNIAFSSNMIPTQFWLLYHIFSDPTVLADCRAEVEKAHQDPNNWGDNHSVVRYKRFIQEPGMILRFDVLPVCVKWPRMTVENSSQIAAVDQLDHDVEIEFKPCQNVSQAGWAAEFSA
ncbi:hypothetical protein MFIFM68171_07960 [Madurella fahalii]|uniref:Cytochrome P450 n=1 Tax=Madurella fahalii TaxID=1157608 RepID=A0ABQ0GJ13_9PEZI